jgi:hypothetical protein
MGGGGEWWEEMLGVGSPGLLVMLGGARCEEVGPRRWR